MAANIQTIATRLKQIRKTLEYSIEDVCRDIDLPIERLTQIELAQTRPTGDEVLILASLYECDFRSLIDDSVPPPGELTDILFRRYGNTFSAVDRRSIQEFLHICQIESSLEGLLGIRKAPFPEPKVGNFYKGDGQAAAETLRSHLNHKENEVQHDIYADFRSIGVHILRQRLVNNDISGLYIQDPVAGHCVLINYNEDVYRQRFSVCHEVAHSIFDSSARVMLTYETHSSKYNKAELIEIRANSFASNYLMPVHLLQRIGTLDESNIAPWAQKFRVSVSALLKALKDAKLIDQGTISKLRAIRVPASAKIDPEAPENLTDSQRARRLSLLERGLSDYFVNLCFEAHYKELISTGRLIEALRISQSDLPEIAVLFGRTVNHGF
jgi:Zn-dependent peptidase ImmA (M78 family)